MVKFYASVTEDLVLYARQLGWFHAIPKSDKPSKQKAISRGERITSNGGTPLMPQVDAEYLLLHWHSMGLVSTGAMGAIALSSHEIMAWSCLSAVELEPWEFNCIRQMSQNYVSSLHSGENANEPPPFGSLAQEFDKTIVGNKVVNAFKSFIMVGRKT